MRCWTGPALRSLFGCPSPVLGDDVVAVQSNTAGYAVNRSQGVVTRIDSPTWQFADARPLANSTTGLTAVASDQALFILDTQRGAVARADQRTLAPIGAEQSLSAIRGTSAPVVDEWRGALAAGFRRRRADQNGRTARTWRHRDYRQP